MAPPASQHDDVDNTEIIIGHGGHHGGVGGPLAGAGRTFNKD